MGRRFLLGTEAAFVGMAVGVGWSWFSARGVEGSASIPFLLACGAPSLAGLLLLILTLAIPGLTPLESIERPLTVTLPAVHTAATVLAARAMLTGPVPVAAHHEALASVEVWFRPMSWAALMLGQLLILEFGRLIRARRTS